MEHLPIRTEHCEHPALGVIGELKAIAAIRLSIILVGADQPHHLAVAVINRALHAAIPLDAPDLPVEQVVLHLGLAVLVSVLHSHDVPTGIVGQLLGGPTAGLDTGVAPSKVISKLRPGLETVQLLERNVIEC